MKRTQEFTSVHYRRSVKRPVSHEGQSQRPVCGSVLPPVQVNDKRSAQSEYSKAAIKRIFGVDLDEVKPPDKG
jgi:hypothetical protein